MNLVCKISYNIFGEKNREVFSTDWILDDIKELLSIFLDMIKVL